PRKAYTGVLFHFDDRWRELGARDRTRIDIGMPHDVIERNAELPTQLGDETDQRIDLRVFVRVVAVAVVHKLDRDGKLVRVTNIVGDARVARVVRDPEAVERRLDLATLTDDVVRLELPRKLIGPFVRSASGLAGERRGTRMAMRRPAR